MPLQNGSCKDGAALHDPQEPPCVGARLARDPAPTTVPVAGKARSYNSSAATA